MGQSDSNLFLEQLPSPVHELQDQIAHHGRLLYSSARCNYQDFIQQINHLNELCRKLTSSRGQRLIFGIKKGTDLTWLWRATVRIAVLQVDTSSFNVLSRRLLNLPQFLRVFTNIQDQFMSVLPATSRVDESSTSSAGCSDEDNGEPSGSLGSTKNELTISRLFNDMDLILSDADGQDKLIECCICLERRPDVILPCAHSYCLPCIEQWNTVHKTCPICREDLQTTDEAWVIEDIPGSEDISQEICNNLLKLARDPNSKRF